MKLSKLFFNTLEKSLTLRLKAALALGITEQAINMAVARKSKTMYDVRLINAVKAETGFTDLDIFEQEAETAHA